MRNKIILLRGVASSGKTTFANYLSDIDTDSVICCADDFFYKNGEYLFDASKLGMAHYYCYNKFLMALDDGKKTIIIANTNAKEKDFSPYERKGKEAGYQIISLVVEKRHENKNSHNVPQETLDRQELNIRNSLKLQ